MRRRLYPIVTMLLFVVLALLALLVLAMGFGMATGKFRVLPVLSNSMAPTLSQGDLLLAERISPEAARVGDIVVAHAPEDQALLVHRVLTVRAENGATIVRTKGDANQTADAWETVLSDKAVLRVDHSLPLGRTPLWQMASPGALGFLRVVLFPAFVYFAFRRIWGKPRKVLVDES